VSVDVSYDGGHTTRRSRQHVVAMQASAMHAAALSAPPLPVAAAARRSALPRRRASAPHRPSPCRALSSVGNDADAAPPPPPRLRRREALSVAAACVAAALSPVAPALAAGKGKAKTLPDEAYSALPVRLVSLRFSAVLGEK
jgi:hypothetical protein